MPYWTCLIYIFFLFPLGTDGVSAWYFTVLWTFLSVCVQVFNLWCFNFCLQIIWFLGAKTVWTSLPVCWLTSCIVFWGSTLLFPQPLLMSLTVFSSMFSGLYPFVCFFFNIFSLGLIRVVYVRLASFLADQLFPVCYCGGRLWICWLLTCGS